MFIARAVQLGQPVLPLGKFITISKVPKSHTIYEANHPDRIEKFPLLPEVSDELLTDNTNLTETIRRGMKDWGKEGQRFMRSALL